LIVEDEALIAADIQSSLEDHGHEVVGVAADTQEAVELARRYWPEIALVDMNLRDGPTGPWIAAMLVREHGVGVMFVTSEAALAPLNAPGVLGAFPKPFAGERLAQAIARAPSVRDPLPDPIRAVQVPAPLRRNERGRISS
jgi:DNA-binding response OmpR family regulator